MFKGLECYNKKTSDRNNDLDAQPPRKRGWFYFRVEEPVNSMKRKEKLVWKIGFGKRDAIR